MAAGRHSIFSPTRIDHECPCKSGPQCLRKRTHGTKEGTKKKEGMKTQIQQAYDRQLRKNEKKKPGKTIAKLRKLRTKETSKTPTSQNCRAGGHGGKSYWSPIEEKFRQKKSLTKENTLVSSAKPQWGGTGSPGVFWRQSGEETKKRLQ